MTPDEAKRMRQQQDAEVKVALVKNDKLKPNSNINKAISQCDQVKSIAKAEVE